MNPNYILLGIVVIIIVSYFFNSKKVKFNTTIEILGRIIESDLELSTKQKVIEIARGDIDPPMMKKKKNSRE